MVESGDGEGERERQEKRGERGVETPEGEPQSRRRKPREDEEEARSPHVGDTLGKTSKKRTGCARRLPSILR